MADTKTEPMGNLDFGAPVKVDPKNRPESKGRGGKPSVRPAYVKWLESLPATGEYELGGGDANGAHPISRLNQMRKVAKELGGFKVDSVTIQPNKLVRIFVHREATNGDAPTEAPAKAPKASKSA